MVDEVFQQLRIVEAVRRQRNRLLFSGIALCLASWLLTGFAIAYS